MPNPFFRFKQFTVYHDKCAMKVCTDACLFGAWVAGYCVQNNIQPEHILDIGAGTGLLSLVLAQQLNGSIEAVEIEQDDFVQCSENFERSEWSERLQAHWADIKNFQSTHRYSLIITNPPFFENDLAPQNVHKKRAKHEHSLSIKELFTEALRLLSPEGYFALLLPHHRETEACTLAAATGLYPDAIIQVKQTPLHSPFRSMMLFQHKQKEWPAATITIKNERDEYTGEFTALLKDYYLYL